MLGIGGERSERRLHRSVEVLGELRRFLGGEKATLRWDGLPSHRGVAMRELSHPHVLASPLGRLSS
jgi:hypothetical protein